MKKDRMTELIPEMSFPNIHNLFGKVLTMKRIYVNFWHLTSTGVNATCVYTQLMKSLFSDTIPLKTALLMRMKTGLLWTGFFHAWQKQTNPSRLI